MKILIITAFFPPLNSIASLRPASWAKYWSEAGHQVTVLTTLKNEISPNTQKKFEIIELRVPLQRDMPPGLAVKKSLMANEKPLLRLREKYGFFHSCRMPDKHDLWQFRAFSSIKNRHWDLVISTGGPYSTHGIAYRLKNNNKKIIWIMDWRDLWTQNHIFPGLPIIRNIERLIELHWQKQADIITTVSDPLAKNLEALYKRSVHVIPNGFDTEATALPKRGITHSPKILTYTGTIYPNHQDLKPILLAIKELHQAKKISPQQIQLEFYGNCSAVSELAISLGAEDYVKHFSTISHTESIKKQINSDALLFIDFDSENQGIVTGKIFEYISSGTPIIFLGKNCESDAAKIIKQSRSGITLKNHHELIKDAIIQIVDGLLESQPRNLEFIHQFHRKNLAEKMINLASDIFYGNKKNTAR